MSAARRQIIRSQTRPPLVFFDTKNTFAALDGRLPLLGSRSSIAPVIVAVCNDPKEISGLEAHHRTYARFGNEDAADLTALCRACHGVVTDHLRRRRYASRQRNRTDFKAALENPTDLFDPTPRRVRK